MRGGRARAADERARCAERQDWAAQLSRRRCGHETSNRCSTPCCADVRRLPEETPHDHRLPRPLHDGARSRTRQFRDAQLAALQGPDAASRRRRRRSATTRSARPSRRTSCGCSSERGADMTIFSPRASAMAHHEGDERVSHGLDARLQRPDQARRRAVSRRTSSASASCRSRRASPIAQLDRRARALRERARLRRLQPQPRPVRRPLDLAAADRPALVSVLREDGRARRAGDDPRLGVVQPELPRHRRALHQRRHHRLHAVHPGRPVPRLPDAALHHPARRRRGALPLGPLPRPRRHAEAPAARAST